MLSHSDSVARLSTFATLYQRMLDCLTCCKVQAVEREKEKMRAERELALTMVRKSTRARMMNCMLQTGSQKA